MPLTGIRVVALEQAVAAPFCTRQLADLGAEVIKIERPDGGDPARGYDNVLRGESAYFAWLNRGKQSVVLDLRKPVDRNACGRLVATADVLVQNMAPGTAERLGLGYDALAAQDPALIWCGISGYGPDGPMRDKKAYDMLVQAESGVVSVTGSPEAPAKVGTSIADIASGMYAFSSVLAALIARQQSGKGQRIDISMLECLTEWMTPSLSVWWGAGRVVPRAGMRHNMVAPYGAYPCRDGYVMFAVLTEVDWQRFCRVVMETPALAADPRFDSNAKRVENRNSLEAMIESRFGGFSCGDVLALLGKADIPTGSVNDVAAVTRHPQLAARGRITEVDSPSGPIPALRPPHNLGSVPSRMGRVPALGEHTAAILKEIGVAT